MIPVLHLKNRSPVVIITTSKLPLFRWVKDSLGLIIKKSKLTDFRCSQINTAGNDSALRRNRNRRRNRDNSKEKSSWNFFLVSVDEDDLDEGESIHRRITR
uniref:Uncharacterized protein n=1 Tax=Opuntia streptacantha TaxID=393608 RepID=A0A7C9EST3_OPUST